MVAAFEEFLLAGGGEPGGVAEAALASALDAEKASTARKGCTFWMLNAEAIRELDGNATLPSWQVTLTSSAIFSARCLLAVTRLPCALPRASLP